MVTSVKELHKCPVGDVTYWFRTPTVFDLPRMRRSLSREGIRRPSLIEFRVAALAGLTALGEKVGDPAEAERQRALIERWYELLAPVDENEIDEPDFERRTAEVERLNEERKAERQELVAEISAIEATLARHWPPYRELVADRDYWNEVSEIEVVRLLLQRNGEADLPQGGDGMLTDAAYQALPRDHRAPLAAFAMRLLAPTETQRKN